MKKTSQVPPQEQTTMAPKKAKGKSPNKGNFILKNELLTIRFWSQAYTTSLFDKNVNDFTLICQYPISNFNLDILKDFNAAQLYLNIDSNVYVSRVSGFVANITPESIVMQLSLANLRLKAAIDLEFNTPAVIFEQILAQKDFFKVSGKKLEDFVKPLGFSRKLSETDQALRRRTLEYLNYKMSLQADPISEADLRRLRGETNG